MGGKQVNILRNVVYGNCIVDMSVKCGICSFIIQNFRFAPRFKILTTLSKKGGFMRCVMSTFDLSRLSARELFSRVSYSSEGTDIIISFNVSIKNDGTTRSSPLSENNKFIFFDSRSGTIKSTLDGNLPILDKVNKYDDRVGKSIAALYKTGFANYSTDSKVHKAKFSFIKDKYAKGSYLGHVIDVGKRNKGSDTGIGKRNQDHRRDIDKRVDKDADEEILFPYLWNSPNTASYAINTLNSNNLQKGIVNIKDIRFTSFTPSNTVKGIVSLLTTPSVNNLSLICSSTASAAKKEAGHQYSFSSSSVDTRLVPCRLKVSDEIWNMITKDDLSVSTINETVEHTLFSIGRRMYDKSDMGDIAGATDYGSDPLEKQCNRSHQDDDSNVLTQRAVQDIFLAKQSEVTLYIDNVKTCVHKQSNVHSLLSFSLCMKIKSPDTFSLIDDWASTFGQWSIESYRSLSSLVMPHT